MNNEKTKLYIVDMDDDSVKRLTDVFFEDEHLNIKPIGSSHNYNSTINDIDRAKKADVYLISAYLPDEMGIGLIPKLKKVNPEASFIIVLKNSVMNLKEDALREGADHILIKPYKVRSLIEAIYELTDIEPDIDNQKFEEDGELPPGMDKSANLRRKMNETRRKEEERNSPHAMEDEDEDEEEEEEEELDKKNSRRTLFDTYTEDYDSSNILKDSTSFDGEKPNVVCTFSSVSSSGKTSMAVNTAVSIKKNSEYDPKIVIVDFDIIFPSVFHKFHDEDLIQPKKNMFQIMEDLNFLDESLIKDALVTHEPTGIQFMHPPANIVRSSNIINPEGIEQLIAQLREMFDLVIIDTSTDLKEDGTSYPLSITDKGVVLMEPDLTSLLRTRKFLNIFREFEKEADENITSKLNIVLNRHRKETKIDTDTFNKTLKSDIKLEIPEDPTFTQTVNNGYLPADSNNATSRAIKQLGDMIYPLEIQDPKLRKKKKGNSLFSGFLKK